MVVHELLAATAFGVESIQDANPQDAEQCGLLTWQST
jgi:hypothetical protein